MIARVRIIFAIRGDRRNVGLLLRVLLPLLIGLSAPSIAAAQPEGSLTGVVIDAETGDSLDWATTTILELERAEPTHDGGRFLFEKIPSGHYTLRVSFVGYVTMELVISVPPEDTAAIVIALEPTNVSSDAVVVHDRRGERRSTFEAGQTIAGAELQQELGSTLAETMANLPGVAQSSMGPATARPVVRGLGGDRLLILEDGAQTGDASSISADHAVAVDPLAAERIEILRGPASLLFSGNALAGVVNVVREKTITNLPDRTHGTATLQGSSVDLGYAAGLSIGVPFGPFAFQLNGSGRRAGDIDSPDGTLRNTDVETFDGSAGLAWLFDRGGVDASGGYYATEYGIPGGFAGAHPDGVRVAMNKSHGGLHIDYYPKESLLDKVEAYGDYTRYYHKEIESTGGIGTEYGIVTTSGALRVGHGALGPFDRGGLAIQVEGVDFAADGVDIPRTDEISVGAGLTEERSFGKLTIEGGIRFDFNTLTPEQNEITEAGEIRERTFAGLSGSVSVGYGITPEISALATATRTFRPPSVEELFSNGPHLAAYFFQVGNADLNEEIGLSLETSLRWSADRFRGEISVYRNAINDYIYTAATGDTNFRTVLPIYRYIGEDVTLAGVEIDAEWEALDRIVLTGSAGYVRGTRSAADRPLPMIPPLSASLGARYHLDDVFAGLIARGAAHQNRIGDFEEPTPGYVTFDAYAQYRLTTSSMLHTIVLSIDNILDASYRNHLSRTKSVMPEPGRNVRVLYRAHF